MAFINEYISEADYEKYELKRVCEEYNRAHHRGLMYADSWAIDREREVFLIKIWVHRESEFSGYAFYWKGEWMFFDMRPIDSKYDQARNEIWFRFLVKNFSMPGQLNVDREALMGDLHEAVTVKGAVTGTVSRLPAAIDFITE